MSHRKVNQLKKRQEHEERSFSELPEDIIVEILAKIPPKFLYETFRYVCKAWYRLISSTEFIHKNDIHHKPGILIQVPKNYRCTCKTTFLEMDDEKQLGLNFNLTNFGSRMGLIKSSCNGLILVAESRQTTAYNILCVKNSLTGSILSLPNCPSGCKHQHGVCGSALGFNPLTKEHKVVHIYVDGYGFEMFTIGSDNNAWRRIPGPFEGPHDKPFNIEQFRWSDPVSINGQVFHWFVDSENYIISLDVSNEKVRKTNLPDFGKRIVKRNYDLVAIDGKLSFVYKASKFKIDVWVLNDFERQVWSKEHSIIANSTNFATLGASSGHTKEEKLPHFMKLAAVATLRNGEVIMLKHKKNSGHHDFMYLYDFKSKEMRKFKMKMKEGQKFIPHRSSLVSWRTEMDLSAKIRNISL